MPIQLELRAFSIFKFKMTTKISIISHSCNTFADEIHRRLGKGRLHASLVYQEWFRKGSILADNPAFNNSKKIHEEIIAETDFAVLPFSDKRDDGSTGKILLQTDDKLDIEAVLIPMRAGGTLCVSSQVGCKMGCSFCETGRMGLLRNLTPAEIISQIFVARLLLNFEMRNIVFMGMGEPFDNYDHVMHAFRIITDPHGLSFGHNHVTISTSGRADGIHKLTQENGPIPNLAVSINAPNDLLRNTLMPINKTYNLQTLHEEMRRFNEKTGKEILIAYVLIQGLNDTPEHANELAVYLQRLNVKINLIPYNRQSNDRYNAPDKETIDTFARALQQEGFQTLIRQSKGEKIMAACGQLGNLKLKRHPRTNPLT